MQFSVFAQFLKQLENTASRLSMTDQVVELFRSLDEPEIQPACYLLQGRLVPQFESLEFNLSNKMVLRALDRFSDTPSVSIDSDLFGEPIGDSASASQKLFKELGDIGLVAEAVIENWLVSHQNTQDESITNQRVQLDLLAVFGALEQIAKESGEGSQERKLDGLFHLFSSCDPLSARYIARVVVGKLRLGFSTMTMLDALSYLDQGDKRWSAQLEHAWEKRADLGVLATLWVLETRKTKPEYVQLLRGYSVVAGAPVMPALCQRLNTAQEIVEKLGEVVVEPKYDGLRVQIHLHRTNAQAKPTVAAFTRSLEDCTHMFPELQRLAALIQSQSCILDCEAIGFDSETGELKPFQETITRKRKHNVAAQAESVPIRFYVFDILELNGKSLLSMPLLERKTTLAATFGLPTKSDQERHKESFYLTPYVVTTDPEIVHAFHEAALAEGLEGAVIKQSQSEYQSGRKGWRWVKIKESEGSSGKLSDTIDCVVMGYYKGRGKRTQFGLGALLVGVLNIEQSKGAQTERVLSIAKIGTGMSEETLVQLKKLLDEHAMPTKPSHFASVDKSITPDAWVEPSVVVEVAADELTDSSVHVAKLALRFPRLLRIREDKTWLQATTMEEVAELRSLFLSQKPIK